MNEQYSILLEAHETIIEIEEVCEKLKIKKEFCDELSKMNNLLQTKYKGISIDDVEFEDSDYYEGSRYCKQRDIAQNLIADTFYEREEKRQTRGFVINLIVAILLSCGIGIAGTGSFARFFTFESLAVVAILGTVVYFIGVGIRKLITKLGWRRRFVKVYNEFTYELKNAIRKDNAVLKADILKMEQHFEEFKTNQEHLAFLIKYVEDMDILPEHYRNSQSTAQLLKLFDDKMASTITEAIQVYTRRLEEQARHDQIVAMQQAHNAQMQAYAAQQVAATMYLAQTQSEMAEAVKSSKGSSSGSSYSDACHRAQELESLHNIERKLSD